MNRKEAYQKIKELNLQDEVVKRYGDNYTRVSTDKLCELINSVQQDSKQKVVDLGEEDKVMTNPYEAACLVFVGLLKDTGALDDILKRL